MKRDRRGFRFGGLAAQIVLWTVLPLTLVLIGVAFTGVYSHERAMRLLVEERDRALAMVSAAQVRESLLQRASALQKLAGESAFVRQDLAAQRALLAEAGNLNGLFAGPVALLDDGGNTILTGGETPAWTAAEQPLAALAQTVMARQDVDLSPVLGTPDSANTFLLGVPVYGPAGSVVGVLAGPLSPSSLALDTLLSGAEIGEHGSIYLVDASGCIVAHSQGQQAQAGRPADGAQALSQAGAAESATPCQVPEGERMVLASAPLGLGTGWQVIIQEPWDKVMGPVLRYSQAMPLVAALAAVVALLTLYYGIHSLVRPLRALKRETEKMAWGDFDAAASSVGGVDEIEELRRAMHQMAKRIQGYQRSMHDYIAAITQGQEDERKRLARELHDETAQALIALGQQVEMAQKLRAANPKLAAERLATVREMLAGTLEGVRRFSRDLRPIYLEDLGFLPALEMLVNEAGQRQGMVVDLRTIGTVRRLPSDLELATYRIVQEALNNVVQHARASHAWVQVRFEQQSLVLTVRDNGQGFEVPDLPDAMARQGHFGLMGIQERALLYGGKLSIRSSPGEGTELTVWLAHPAEPAFPSAT